MRRFGAMALLALALGCGRSGLLDDGTYITGDDSHDGEAADSSAPPSVEDSSVPAEDVTVPPVDDVFAPPPPTPTPTRGRRLRAAVHGGRLRPARRLQLRDLPGGLLRHERWLPRRQRHDGVRRSGRAVHLLRPALRRWHLPEPVQQLRPIELHRLLPGQRRLRRRSSRWRVRLRRHAMRELQSRNRWRQVRRQRGRHRRLVLLSHLVCLQRHDLPDGCCVGSPRRPGHARYRLRVRWRRLPGLHDERADVPRADL